MNLNSLTRQTEKLAPKIHNYLAIRQAKYLQRSDRWKKSKSGRKWQDDSRIILELYQAVDNFKTVINQPFEEEE